MTETNVPLVKHVHVGDGAWHSIPNRMANEEGGLEWRMRYSQSDKACLSAASVIGSFEYLLSDEISQKEAFRRLKILRAEWKAGAP